MHQISDLISIFDNTFYRNYQTRLIRGDDEPIYRPADNEYNFHRIIFAHGYYASGMHEIAHWLIAGEKRRLIEDYGYWYSPDGRSGKQQAEFEKVEIKPQAIEWALCIAAGFKFNVSADNLNGEQPCRVSFQKKVHQQIMKYIANGFSQRTQQLLKALSDFYQTPWPLTEQRFNW
ncbi:ATPase [Pseudoalteromonas sp. NBT06-2]|uniref:elongation factor P hydroxylase n=1 Tax=Pseudoalteromonas sp. NBT06-2 TaxID=2025950 RepID=UPI000BA58ADC|nr:elongation factor P hydroxylase [Pseudoalteromonas sp. NBT06-2]PAJ73683.1 ATPase [Pseudoalteromonas sp. NBT06-2]